MEDVAATTGIFLATLVAGGVSGLLPVFNSELYLVGVVLVVGSPMSALVLAVLLAIGQVAAKAVLYAIARGASNLGRGRFAARLERARLHARRWRDKPYTVTFLSAVVGLPPFYLMALAAGVLEIRLARFLWIALVGRVIRFGAIGLIVHYA